MSCTNEPHRHPFARAVNLSIVVLLLGAVRLSAQNFFDCRDLCPRNFAFGELPGDAQFPAAPTEGQGSPHPLARWLDAQALNVSARYNYIGNARDETVQNRMQTQVQVRARLKIDEAGRYSIHVGLFTGNGFTTGWNPTGIGTGEGTAKIYLKQLFVAAEPWKGIELQSEACTGSGGNPQRSRRTTTAPISPRAACPCCGRARCSSMMSLSTSASWAISTSRLSSAAPVRSRDRTIGRCSRRSSSCRDSQFRRTIL